MAGRQDSDLKPERFAAQLRDEIARDDQRLRAKRLLLQSFESAYDLAPPARTQGRKGKRRRVAAGSLEDRILGLAPEPVKLAVLVDGAGARKGDVKKAVKQLVSAGQLKQIGKRAGTTVSVGLRSDDHRRVLHAVDDAAHPALIAQDQRRGAGSEHRPIERDRPGRVVILVGKLDRARDGDGHGDVECMAEAS